MTPKIDINNVIAVASTNAEQRQAAFEAVKQIAAEFGDKVQVGEDRVLFHCEWEPPFKALKKLSKEMPDVSFTLWADAFQKSHWICKVEYLEGKGEEQTLSRIDDDFPGIFKEIFGIEEPSWQKKQTASFQAWFPSAQ
ncbi:hypothetical protein [Cerasicoccus arenae]|uniref:Uncharacterized protein n=1 Tax=Cerasicoccus arenae TaxID=424488 RepID=A0A8J3DF72_9BACT|nr:hypothetical protein [Cerasicoccus arenae]MBK1859117.1 hypothetical protein [Cerasicoccus arenae]GHB91872.1 hypothetical protein GCM10007047_03480 [Cerasicoccus arenae]